MKFFIFYRVQGQPQEFTAGPYDTFEEATYHFNDIAGFEGVWDVRLTQR